MQNKRLFTNKLIILYFIFIKKVLFKDNSYFISFNKIRDNLKNKIFVACYIEIVSHKMSCTEI
jgi:hypothetical protein